jgi:hypothetical protein
MALCGMGAVGASSWLIFPGSWQSKLPLIATSTIFRKPDTRTDAARSPSLVEASSNKNAEEKLNCQRSSVAGRAQLSEELGCHQCMEVVVGEDI